MTLLREEAAVSCVGVFVRYIRTCVCGTYIHTYRGYDGMCVYTRIHILSKYHRPEARRPCSTPSATPARVYSRAPRTLCAR